MARSSPPGLACCCALLLAVLPAVSAEVKEAVQTLPAGQPSPRTLDETHAGARGQTIELTAEAPATAPFGSVFTVAALASSGLPVSIAGTGACRGEGLGSAVIAMTAGAGTCTLHFRQPGAGDVGPAPVLTRLTAATKAPQSLRRTAVYGSTFIASAAASSGLPVAIAASGACTGSGQGETPVTMTSGTGVCTLLYRQAGDADHAAVETREEVLAVRAPQEVHPAPLPATLPYGAAFGVAATASSGLPVDIRTEGVCAGGGSGEATIALTAGVGTCTLHLSQAGDENFLPAPDLTRTLAAVPALLSVTPSPAGALRQYGDPNPPFVPAYTGFVVGEGPGDLSEVPNCGTTATPESPPGLYPVTCAGGRATNYTLSHGSGTSLRVAPEAAAIALDPDTPAALKAKARGQYSWRLDLGTTLREWRPDQGRFGTAPGDIGTAGLALALLPLAGGEPNPLRCRPGPVMAPNGDARRAFACTLSRGLGNGVYEISAQATGNYEGQAADALSVLDLDSPWPQGGGWFDWPGTRERTSFGFALRPTRGEGDSQGHLLVVRHHGDGRFSRLRSESVTGLVLGERDDAGCGTVTFSGKATYTAWDPSANEGLGAYISTPGNPFMAYGEDCNRPGAGRDSFLIRGGGALDMPMQVYRDKVPLVAGRGEVVVPHRPPVRVP